MEGGKCLGGVVLGRKERNWVRSGWPGGCACRKALEKHESLICARKLGQSETTDSPANNSQVFRVLQFSFTISVLVCLHFEHETHIGHKCFYCLNSQTWFKVYVIFKSRNDIKNDDSICSQNAWRLLAKRQKGSCGRKYAWKDACDPGWNTTLCKV